MYPYCNSLKARWNHSNFVLYQLMEKCRIGITTQIWILTGIDWHHTLFLKKQKSLETSCFQGFLVARAGLDDLQEKPLTRHLCKNASVLAPSFAIYPRNRETKTATFRWLFSFLVAGVGFEPHDLRVMSPTSYQAALLRDIEFFVFTLVVPVTGVEPVRYFRITGF